MNAQPEFELRLRAVAGHWQAAPIQRLRGLLKVALRGFGFRCEICRPVPPVEPREPAGSPSARPGNCLHA